MSIEFPRQWFDPKCRIAYQEKTIQFENSLVNGDYQRADYLLSSEDLSIDIEYSLRQRNRLEHLKARRGALIKLSFAGFWGSFNREDNPLTDLLKSRAALDIKSSQPV